MKTATRNWHILGCLERPNVGHQLRGGASQPGWAEGASASLPSWIWVPISHVSCMPLLAGGTPQETRRTDDKYATSLAGPAARPKT